MTTISRHCNIQIMATSEQQTSEAAYALSEAEKGQQAFNFIQTTANRLALLPEFQLALVREFFDRDAQTYPRYYGVNVVKGPYIWHIVSFGNHERVKKPNGDSGLEISKYDAGLDPDKAFAGSIHTFASWVERWSEEF